LQHLKLAILLSALGINGRDPPLDRKATFRQVLPGVAFADRSPLNRQLREIGLQGRKHNAMVANDTLRGVPLGDCLAEDLAQPREVLPVEAARPDNGPTVAVEDQEALDPLVVDLDEVPQIGKPDLVGRRGMLRTLVRMV
jgi:hypothetical protein